MKRFALLPLWLLPSVTMLGQGTVNFVNDSMTLSTPPDRLIRFAYDYGGPLGGTAAAGTNYQVQLYYGASTASENNLIPLSAAPARLRTSTSTAVGTWLAGGMRTFSGVNFGTTVALQVRVWDINYGQTYEQAITNGGLSGRSPIFRYTIPATPTNPPAEFAMSDFRSFYIGGDEWHDPPHFTSDPMSKSVVVNDDVIFYVTTIYPSSYQWFFNGTSIPGETSSSLILYKVQLSQAGTYFAMAWNYWGARQSSDAVLTVIAPQLSIRQPAPSEIQVAWRTNLKAYVLESATSIGSSWLQVTDTPAIQGNEFVLTQDSALSQKFFRLRKP